MMSYADMVTTLLAMFIVLSTLGKDQTGINLYNGTGSFVHSQQSFGLPGLFPNSSKVITLEEAGPHYQIAGPDSWERPRGDSPEANQRIIDGEVEYLQQFLDEMARSFPVAKRPRETGQVVFDYYERLNRTSPYLGANQAGAVSQVTPLLSKPDYRITVIVWASTPGEAAWARAADQARRIVEEIATTAGLDTPARARLVPLGQPWRYSKLQRPVLSLVISRSEQTD